MFVIIHRDSILTLSSNNNNTAITTKSSYRNYSDLIINSMSLTRVVQQLNELSNVLVSIDKTDVNYYTTLSYQHLYTNIFIVPLHYKQYTLIKVFDNSYGIIDFILVPDYINLLNTNLIKSKLNPLEKIKIEQLMIYINNYENIQSTKTSDLLNIRLQQYNLLKQNIDFSNIKEFIERGFR